MGKQTPASNSTSKSFHRCEEDAKEREENSWKVELAQKDEAIERLSAITREREGDRRLEQGVKLTVSRSTGKQNSDS